MAYKKGVTTSRRHGGFHELTPNVSPAVADGSGTTAGHRALEGNGLGVCYFVHPSFKPAARVGPGRAVPGPQASEAAPCHPTPAAPTAGSLAQDVGWGKGPWDKHLRPGLWLSPPWAWAGPGRGVYTHTPQAPGSRRTGLPGFCPLPGRPRHPTSSSSRACPAGTRHTPQGCAQSDAQSGHRPSSCPFPSSEGLQPGAYFLLAAGSFLPACRFSGRSFSRQTAVSASAPAFWFECTRGKRTSETLSAGHHPPAPGVRATVVAGVRGQRLHVRTPEGVTGTLGPTGDMCWHWPPGRSALWPREGSVCCRPCRAGDVLGEEGWICFV